MMTRADLSLILVVGKLVRLPVRWRLFTTRKEMREKRKKKIAKMKTNLCQKAKVVACVCVKNVKNLTVVSFFR